MNGVRYFGEWVVKVELQYVASSTTPGLEVARAREREDSKPHNRTSEY